MATQAGELPDDALAGVFHGLPPRSLAVIRCVCKAWRDVVDGRALLLRHLHLLPLTVRGVFANCKDEPHPYHLARPRPRSPATTTPNADGTLSFLPGNGDRRRWVSVLDHCGGLLLCGRSQKEIGGELCVCNPATRRWTVLPRWWSAADDDRRRPYAGAYLAFDPAESPEYQVILVPAVPEDAPPPPRDWTAAEMRRREELQEAEKHAPFCLDWFFSLPEPEPEPEDGAAGTAAAPAGQWEFEELPPHLQPCRYSEWPPAAWTMRVFSSSTGQWEDREFGREGLPVGTLEKVRLDLEELRRPHWRYAVYHHGSLFVHCRGSFVTRLSLSKSKYQVIETPTNVNEYKRPYLGKLHYGVCFGLVHDHRLKIWILNEACGQMQWVLKYETVVGHYAEHLASISYDFRGRRHKGSWTIEENFRVQDTYHDVEYTSEEESIETQDIDHDVESLSEEEDTEILDTSHESLSEEDHDVGSLSEGDHYVESLSAEDHDVDSLSEEDHDVESLSEEDHDVESQSEEGHGVESLSSSEENIEIQQSDHANYLSKEQNIESHDTNHEVESLLEEGHEWDSDNDDTFTVNNNESKEYFDNRQQLDIIGFHPCKEVVFMVRRFQVVAYHLNGTKIQYLGNVHPEYYYSFWDRIYQSFLYTPCMIGDMLHGDQTIGQSSVEDE